MTQHDDPHAEVHAQAVQQHEDHPDALADAAGDETIEEKLNKVDQRLTTRINDLRKDFDATRKAISNSVNGFQQSIADLKTATENNKASIESLSGAVDTASRQAKDAKTAADQANSKVEQVEQTLGVLSENVQKFWTEYENHGHTVQASFSADTSGPHPGEPQQGKHR